MVMNSLGMLMVGKNMSFNLVLGLTGVVNEQRYMYYILCKHIIIIIITWHGRPSAGGPSGIVV